MNLSFLDEKVSSLIYDYGALALFIISILLDLIPQLISPIIALSTGIIAGINVHYAVLATILGSTLGSVIGFVLGKKYMFHAVNILTSEKSIERLTYLTNKYGKVVVPLAAISPLPYLPVLLGAMSFSKKNFVIYGIIPRIFSIIIFGYLISIF
ncbi:MAG: VTT domain-containing protein [archaeon]